MNKAEYEKIKGLEYREYCDYLKSKYGVSKYNYFTMNWKRISRVSRTKEGLVVHHIYEDQAIRLSDVEFAEKHPYEWQQAENLVYCDYLEHLYLHILICEQAVKKQQTDKTLGLGGIIKYIAPELNDVYSGWKTKQEWRSKCHSLIVKEKALYLELLKRLHVSAKKYPGYRKEMLCESKSDGYGWSRDKNIGIIFAIRAMLR